MFFWFNFNNYIISAFDDRIKESQKIKSKNKIYKYARKS